MPIDYKPQTPLHDVAQRLCRRTRRAALSELIAAAEGVIAENPHADLSPTFWAARDRLVAAVAVAKHYYFEHSLPEDALPAAD